MSTPTIGYTKKQAERLKYRVDIAMARIEDDIIALGHLVTDHGRGGFFGLAEIETLREQAAELKDIVDRRTRS